MRAKGTLICLLVCLLAVLTVYVPVARAGEEELTVAVSGTGVDVYLSPTSKKPAGILYNGYETKTYPTYKNNRTRFHLTGEYIVWIDLDQAMAQLPQTYNRYDGFGYKEIFGTMQCNGFEAEVCVDKTPLLLTPDGKKTGMTCYRGARTVVWGEFGDTYFVDDYGVTGFIPKKHLSKTADLSFWEACQEPFEPDYENRFEEKTIHTDGGHIHIGDGEFLENGDKVRVRTYTGNGLAQLLDYGFIEARFLDPEGDHATNNVYATVKTDGPLDRLRVEPLGNDPVRKLCSGVRVEVLETTKNTALICLCGSNRSPNQRLVGTVKKEYLAFGDAGEKVKNGCTRVSLKQDYEDDSIIYPAGTAVTVVGCMVAYQAGDSDLLVALTEDGELMWIYDEEGILEPTDPAGYRAKATADVVFREKPNKDGKKIKMLPKGATVEVLLRGECWTMVRQNKTTGYVMSRYLKFLQ